MNPCIRGRATAAGPAEQVACLSCFNCHGHGLLTLASWPTGETAGGWPGEKYSAEQRWKMIYVGGNKQEVCCCYCADLHIENPSPFFLLLFYSLIIVNDRQRSWGVGPWTFKASEVECAGKSLRSTIISRRYILYSNDCMLHGINIFLLASGSVADRPVHTRLERTEVTCTASGCWYLANDQEIAEQLSVAPWHSPLSSPCSSHLTFYVPFHEHPPAPFLQRPLPALPTPPQHTHTPTSLSILPTTPSPNTSTLNVSRSLLGSNGVFMPDAE